ncbi:MAG TPA: hypothetical protein IAB43_12455 [Candidatus Spyradocola merdavium]|nr:hypothetical protein [Candidatus Spyradocola merdavium]
MKNPWRTAICALLLCGAFALGGLPAQAAGAAPAMEAAPASGAAAVPAEITWPAHYRMYRRGLDGAQRAAPRLRERAQCVGEQEVAGRTGLVYTCARSFLGFTWTRTMIVDEQTGLCLAWRAQSAIGDYSLSDGAGDFLCTDFVTQDVALPLSLEGQTA